jgi:hypothetical protein
MTSARLGARDMRIIETILKVCMKKAEFWVGDDGWQASYGQYLSWISHFETCLSLPVSPAARFSPLPDSPLYPILPQPDMHDGEWDLA